MEKLQPKVELTDIEKAILHDQAVMAGWKVAAIPCSSPADNDAELSEGEFTQRSNHQRDEYLRKRAGTTLVEEAKKRKKKADREMKRLGGPIVLWTFKGVKKGETIMAKKEEMAEKVQEEKAEKKAAKEKARTEKKAAAKKGKTKKTAKKVKTKTKKARKDRGPRMVDGKITLLQKENPKRSGSKAHKRYELYRKHKTVADYLEAGGKRSSLRYDVKHEYIKLSGVKTSEDVKPEKKEKKEKKEKAK